MKYLVVISLPVFLLISGCATTMNKDQCLVADWRTAGYEDGTAGRSEEWLARRGDACAKYGVTPNLDEYLVGRNDGLRVFCRPRRGFEIGRRGKYYNNVCPNDLEGPFLVAFQDGKGIFDRERHYNNIEDEIANSLQELDVLDNQITDATVALATGNMSDVDRIDLAINLKNMAEERGRIKERLPQMEADLDQARYDLDTFSASILPKYPGAS